MNIPVHNNKKIFKINSDLELKLTILKKVFYPTLTSIFLINCSLKKIRKPSKILDIGCGSGIVGISLYKLGKINEPVYFSDISKEAIQNLKINASNHKINFIAKKGSLFEPWQDYKFDYIINTVSGISQSIATKSKWYQGVSCKAGVEGTNLVNKIISQSKKYLNKNGALIIPTISLSDENKIKTQMKKYFSKVIKIATIDWPLPEEMYIHEKLLNKLKKQNSIDFQMKWGIIICSTSIYMLKK